VFIFTKIKYRYSGYVLKNYSELIPIGIIQLFPIVFSKENKIIPIGIYSDLLHDKCSDYDMRNRRMILEFSCYFSLSLSLSFQKSYYHDFRIDATLIRD